MNGNDMNGCNGKCWMVAGAVGLVVLLFALGAHKGFFAALVLGLIAAGLLGLLFQWLFCSPVPKLGARGAAATTTGGAAAAMAGAAGPASSPAGMTAASGTQEAVADAKAEEESTDATQSLEAAASVGTVSSGGVSAVPGAVSDEETASQADTAEDVAETESAPEEDTSGSLVKPSKHLAGQDDLASRKGDWKYEGDGEETSPAAKGPQAPIGDEAAAASFVEDVDTDAAGDGPAGTQPAAMDAPRDGGADNLKEIKGVGPKLEELLHSLGIYHFDQIAGWSAEEVAWMDSNLKGFKGRVSRDDWIGQAKILAAGGETEFSTRVDKGGVY